MRTVRVIRKAYCKKPHKRITKTKKVAKVPRVCVPKTSFMLTTTGTGKRQRLIKVKRKGALKELGYSVHLPENERRKMIDRAVARYGATRVYRMLQAQVRFRKAGGTKAKIFRPDVATAGRKFETDVEYVKAKYEIEPPKAAIRAKIAMAREKRKLEGVV